MYSLKCVLGRGGGQALDRRSKTILGIGSILTTFDHILNTIKFVLSWSKGDNST